MKAFLKTVAQDMLAKYGTNMSDIAVVFPNKRAALFLNTYLAQLAGKPIWTPTYITISDLFRRHSDLKVADPIKSICDLHKVFVACTGIDETLDHFYGWAKAALLGEPPMAWLMYPVSTRPTVLYIVIPMPVMAIVPNSSPISRR